MPAWRSRACLGHPPAGVIPIAPARAATLRDTDGMRILGLIFAGTSTDHRAQMVSFVADTLSLPRTRTDSPPAADGPAADGTAADLFELPDGSTFAVASPGGMGNTPRSIGFLVDDLDAAAADLRAAGVVGGPIGENDRTRYLHFRAPDRELYELVERKGAPVPGSI